MSATPSFFDGGGASAARLPRVAIATAAAAESWPMNRRRETGLSERGVFMGWACWTPFRPPTSRRNSAYLDPAPTPWSEMSPHTTASFRGAAETARKGRMDLAHKGLRGLPVDAAVGDRDAAAQLADRLGERLAAGPQVALDHGPHDRRVAVADLLEERAH